MGIRLDEQPSLQLKAFAVFDADAAGVLLVFGFVRVVAVGVQVGSYDAVTGRDIGITAVICRPHAVQAEAFQFVFAAAIIIAACAVAVVDSAAIDTSALELLLKSQLIKVVASFVA